MSRACKRNRVKGFTLIELAIVLVVVGLLLGEMIIGGNAIMNQGKTTALIATIKDMAAAAREFKTRYGYFPGDLPNASVQISSVASGSTCDYAPNASIGNGLVDSETESACALEHLVRATLISKADFDTATSAYSIASGYTGTVSLWLDSGTQTNAVRISRLPCAVGLEIDRKFDNATTDNKPFRAGAGTVLALDSSDAAIDTCAPGGANDPIPNLLIRY